MKLRSIDLRRFGRFENTVIDLPASAGLHVLYGPNEAGKTTLLDAITYALHGMPHGNSKEPSYGFLHALPTLRVGLRLEKDDGTELHFLRKRGKSATLLDPVTDSAAPEVEAQLSGVMLGVPKDVWLLRHGLSQERLREGGESLLDADGDTADALFAAATGMTTVRRVLDEVRTQRTALLADSKRTGAVNDAVKEFEAAKKALRDAQSAVDGYDDAVVRRDAINRERELLVGRQADRRARAERIEVVRRVEGLLDERARLVAQRDAIPAPAIRWTQADHEELAEVTQLLREAQGALRELDERIEAEQARVNELASDDQLPAAEEQVAALHQQLESVRAARESLPDLEAAVREARRELERAAAAAEVGVDPGGDDVSAVRAALPSVVAIDALETLVEEGTRLHAARDDAQRQLDTALDKRVKAQAAADEHTVVDEASVEALRSLVDTVSSIDVDGHVTRTVVAAKRRAALEHRAAALGGCTLDLDAVRSLALPSPAQIASIETRLAQLDAEQVEQETALRQARTHLASRRAELEQLEAGIEVPDPAQLQTLRQTRDELWETIRRGVTAPDEPALANAGRAVPEFERAAGRADGFADDLVRDGNRVGQAARLRSEIDADEAREQAARDELNEIATRREACTHEWTSLWGGCGVDPSLPKAMEAFVAEVQAIRAAASELDELEVEVAAGAAAIAGAARELRAALGNKPATDGAGDDGTAVSVLLERARSVLRSATASQQARAETRTELRIASEDVSSWQAALARAERSIESWQPTWTTACEAATLPASASLTVATARVAAVRKLTTAVDAFEHALEKRRHARASVDAYSGAVEELLAALGSAAAQVSADSPELAVAQLQRLVSDAKVAAATRAAHQRQLDGLVATRAEVQAKLTTALSRSDALDARAPGVSRDELHAIDEAWAVRDRVEQLIADLDRQVLEQTRLDVREVLELRGTSSDAELAAAAAQLVEEADASTAELAALQAERDALVERSGAAERSTAAAEARQDMANAAAKIERMAPEYRLLALQETMLEQFIKLQAQSDMGPVVALAADYFRRLTCDRYAVRLDTDERGKAVFRFDRTDDGTTVSVDGLSEGARDQLYLALRLATLVSSLSTGAERMPLIVDDILLTFDDERSAATLALLGDIAADMQVIFLTHHRRLVELASSSVPEDTLAVAELGALGSRGAPR